MKPWDFPYAPVPTAAGDDDGGPVDVLVATSAWIETTDLADAVARVLPTFDVEPVLRHAPLFWWRVRSTHAAPRATIELGLRASGVAVRYVASATRTSQVLGPALSFTGATRARPTAWAAAPPRATLADPATDGRWFLREAPGGVATDRAIATGRGVRLAVIDDDGAEAEQLALEREVLVGVDRVPRATSHGALMVAWASGAEGFQGVAPDASRRLYVIPKPGTDVVGLPLAIARATLDGADVIICATYVEGSTSPMLDDAIALAHAIGRRGRGTAIVLPTGREASSAPGSVHSSWSLALGDPASDPRVFCVGPSAHGRDEWFTWRDKRGRFRPFANRGPAVRWLAPGDDVQYPFGDRDRLFHAESSGASAIAAGVLALVLGANPTLRVRDLDALITRACSPIPSQHVPRERTLADAHDVLPDRADADGHNAKHGYGRMHAGRAVLMALDPVSQALVAMGEREAARAWASGGAPWSPRFARWAARVSLRDESVAHAIKVLARHARLLAGHPERARAHGEGAFARQVMLVGRALLGKRPPPLVRTELERALTAIHARFGAVDRAAQERASMLWATPPTLTPPVSVGVRDVHR